MPLLGDAPFLVVNGDVWCDLDLGRFLRFTVAGHGPQPGIIHAAGDFSLDADRVLARGEQTLTYSGIGVFPPALFAVRARRPAAKLRPLLRAAIAARTLHWGPPPRPLG